MSLARVFRLGRYEILAIVGAGGMGEVYRARDSRLDRTVAVKVLAPHSDAAFPRWRRDGKELFYGTAKGDLMAVDAHAGTAFHTGAPHVLLRPASVRVYKNRFPYAVTSDGRKILVNTLEAATSSVTVLLDWSAGLAR